VLETSVKSKGISFRQLALLELKRERILRGTYKTQNLHKGDFGFVAGEGFPALTPLMRDRRIGFFILVQYKIQNPHKGDFDFVAGEGFEPTTCGL
jgi:hypothetical protein